MSRFRGVSVLMIATVVASGCSGPSTPGREPADRVPASDHRRDPELRETLLQLEKTDQAIREELLKIGYANLSAEDVARQDAVDEANLMQLWCIIAEHGWPTGEQVGADAVAAAFLIVQHADLATQKELLPYVREAAERGDLAGQDLALLTDRVLVGDGLPQRYGTQASLVDGKLVFEPIEDPDGVDARRAQLGLPTMAEYRARLEQAYGVPAEEPDEASGSQRSGEPRIVIDAAPSEPAAIPEPG